MKYVNLVSAGLLAFLLVICSVFATTVTPTCSFGADTPNASYVREIDNTTISAYVITYPNATNVTFSLLPKPRSVGNITQTEEVGAGNVTWLANWTDIPDGVYTIQAVAVFVNGSAAGGSPATENGYINLTSEYAVCTAVDVVVKTSEGAIIGVTTPAVDFDGFDGMGILVIIGLVGIIIYFSRKS